MAHGVLHRVQQRVRACPQTGPLRARVPPRSSETACSAGPLRASRAALHRLAGAPRRDTASCQGSTSRMPRYVLPRCLSGCRLLLTRLADLCLCADAPRAVASVCWPQTGSLLVSHGSRSKSRPSVPAQACREPCTLCRTHSAACPLLLAHRAVNTQPSAAGQQCTQSLCTAQSCSE